MISSTVQAAARVVFLPFDDKVKLNEAWDLSVDVPRWFTQTVDTLPSRDSALICVSFDSVLALIKQNGWKKSDCNSPRVKNILAARFNAEYVVTGSVIKFLVMRRGVDADGKLGNSSSIPLSAINQATDLQGQSNLSVIGGLQSYKAALHLELDIYSVRMGVMRDHVILNTEQKDGGFSVWLPFQTDNSEINFYYLSRTPFGSPYFHKSVVGALMKNFSAEVHRRICVAVPGNSMVKAGASVELKEGKVLECDGREVYINLGSDDSLFAGQDLAIMRPDHALRGEKGDTLGWVEKKAGTIRVQVVKAAHFSLALKMDAADTCLSGWHVRTQQDITSRTDSLAPGIGSQ